MTESMSWSQTTDFIWIYNQLIDRHSVDGVAFQLKKKKKSIDCGPGVDVRLPPAATYYQND